jgi:hypothetical protein
MGLDVLTPKGQQSVRDEQAAVALFTGRFPQYAYCETPKDLSADVDALLMIGGTLRQVVETKCRYDCDMEKFMGQYRGQWLVTYDKLVRAMDVAKALRIGLMGFVYIVPSKTLLVARITDDQGKFLVPFSVQTTRTQATINGGSAVRSNAYINMRGATVIKGVFE